MEGRVYTVTGAASGIGQATAVRLAELGAAGVAISDVNEAGLKTTEELCKKYAPKAKVTIRKLDVRINEDVEKWIEDTYAEFGRLDGAANVAGVAGGEGDTTVETIVSGKGSKSVRDGANVQVQRQKDWEFIMNINLTGVMQCMRAQLAKITKPGGSIVNVSSTSGIHGLPHSAAYAASKHGVIGLTSSAAGEFGKKGVRINSLLPGPIDTQIFRDGEAKGLFSADTMGGDTILGRMGKAEEVAKVLVFLLSDDASYVTGGKWTVDGGYTA
ncbi:MAG: hypothetical protein M1819_002120 [Sarea resinae]|nr:MAG: hypothetical protein M1819_002120 [Sarea resinae]